MMTVADLIKRLQKEDLMATVYLNEWADSPRSIHVDLEDGSVSINLSVDGDN